MPRPKPTIPTVYAAFRIPENVGKLWDEVSRRKNVNKKTIFILALQEYAERNGVTVPEEETEEK
jgi:hypothetical protein